MKRESLAQVFSCEFCEISKNTFFTEHFWTTASELNILRHSEDVLDVSGTHRLIMQVQFTSRVRGVIISNEKRTLSCVFPGKFVNFFRKGIPQKTAEHISLWCIIIMHVNRDPLKLVLIFTICINTCIFCYSVVIILFIIASSLEFCCYISKKD